MKEKEQNIVENDLVSKLLGGLKRVEAPGDFDFRVKARIAAGRPVDRAASWLPGAVQVAMPLGLLLLVGGYFGFNTLYSPNNIGVPAIADVRPVNIAPVIADPTDNVANSPVTEIAAARPEVTSSSNATEKIDPTPPKKLVLTTVRSEKRPGGGSSVEAALRDGKTFEEVTRTPARDVLSQIGIDAAYSNSMWKISGVKANSMAEHSGLKTGDVIEAVNDQNLTEKTAFGNKFSGKSIRVQRDGKIMQIDLKP